jgi:hypothetical protein
MSVRLALQNHLESLGAFSTAYEGVSFTPTNNVPYQRLNLLRAEVDNTALGSAYYREVGIFQVTLFYPLNQGSNPIETRAELIRNHFKRGTGLTNGGRVVRITRTPNVKQIIRDDDRLLLVIDIPYQSEVFPA